MESNSCSSSALLTANLEELQAKLGQMEQELTIVGEESKELQERLNSREQDLKQKVRENILLTSKSKFVLWS